MGGHCYYKTPRDCASGCPGIYPLRKQEALLEKELRSTSQRVNLFEKVKIPEAKENIRIIGVFLGDQQTAAVVRGKISKKKLMEAAQ